MSDGSDETLPGQREGNPVESSVCDANTTHTAVPDGTGTPQQLASSAATRSANTQLHAPRIDGYRIAGRLGEGGMGVVWKAIQLSTKRPVAIKLLSAASFGSDRARLRFEREVELTAKLDHPHVASACLKPVSRLATSSEVMRDNRRHSAAGYASD